MANASFRLLVGLGNPGPEHALTRHNAGFWFLDALARAHGAQFREQRRHLGEVARVRVADRELELFKPMTFMNRSGLAIRSVADFYRIAPAEILIVHDEIDLPVGSVRLKFAGGAGGHNGLRDAIAHIGDGFWRLRLGVGHPRDKLEERGPIREEVVDHVLRRAPRAEEEAILRAIGEALELLPRMLEDGPGKVMNTLHRRKDESAGATPRKERRRRKDDAGDAKPEDDEPT